MKINKGKKYVCVKNLIVAGSGFSWSYAVGVIYEALSDNVVLGEPNFDFCDSSPIGIREFTEDEKDYFVLYDRSLVPNLVKNGVYICIKDYGCFTKGERAILRDENLMCKSGSSVEVNQRQASDHFYLISSLDYDRHDKPYAGFNYICSRLTSPKVMLNERFTCCKDGELKRANGDIVPESALENFYINFSIDYEDYTRQVSMNIKQSRPIQTCSYVCIKDLYFNNDHPVFVKGKIYHSFKNGFISGIRIDSSENFGIHFRCHMPLLNTPSPLTFKSPIKFAELKLSTTAAGKMECYTPKTLKAGDRIIYKVGDKMPDHNGYPFYGHAEIQEVSDNFKYIKIFDKWRSISDIEILDTVNNGEKGNKLE